MSVAAHVQPVAHADACRQPLDLGGPRIPLAQGNALPIGPGGVRTTDARLAERGALLAGGETRRW